MIEAAWLTPRRNRNRQRSIWQRRNACPAVIGSSIPLPVAAPFPRLPSGLPRRCWSGRRVASSR